MYPVKAVIKALTAANMIFYPK
ncbi:unnamed protein product, partial [Rotaria sordida]